MSPTSLSPSLIQIAALSWDAPHVGSNHLNDGPGAGMSSRKRSLKKVRRSTDRRPGPITVTEALNRVRRHLDAFAESTKIEPTALDRRRSTSPQRRQHRSSSMRENSTTSSSTHEKLIINKGTPHTPSSTMFGQSLRADPPPNLNRFVPPQALNR